MTNRAARWLWMFATVALAAGTAFVAARMGAGQHRHGEPERDFHQWMHDRLSLTGEQHEALEPVERAYEAERKRLREEIAAAGRDLAAAVRAGKAGAPEIDAALSRLNGAQAALQRATLDHFFAMKDRLDPGQAEKLLQWTHDSILAD